MKDRHIITFLVCLIILLYCSNCYTLLQLQLIILTLQQEAVEKDTGNKVDAKTESGEEEETAHVSEGSPSESSSKKSGGKRRKSEDELELHPTLDWEEEREGGTTRGEGGRGNSSRDRRRGGSEVKPTRRGGGGGGGRGGGSKVSRTMEGEREEGVGGRERRRGGRVSEGKLQEEMEEPLKPTRPVKVSTVYYSSTYCVYYHALKYIPVMHSSKQPLF